MILSGIARHTKTHLAVIVPVGLVTICVLIYSLDYMKFDPNRNRFYIFLSILAIFMTILVVSDNFVMMLILLYLYLLFIINVFNLY